MEYILFINFKGFKASPCNCFPGKDASPGAGRVCVREETTQGRQVNNAPPKEIPPEVWSCVMDCNCSRRAITAR